MKDRSNFTGKVGFVVAFSLSCGTIWWRDISHLLSHIVCYLWFYINDCGDCSGTEDPFKCDWGV